MYCIFLHHSGPGSFRSWIIPVLDHSGPASLLSCMYASCFASILSSGFPFLHPSCLDTLLFCLLPVLPYFCTAFLLPSLPSVLPLSCHASLLMSRLYLVASPCCFSGSNKFWIEKRSVAEERIVLQNRFVSNFSLDSRFLFRPRWSDSVTTILWSPNGCNRFCQAWTQILFNQKYSVQGSQTSAVQDRASFYFLF